MEISIDIGELRKRSLLVCVPMYGGMCFGNFAKSTNDLTALAAQYGIGIRFYYLFNESLITRARNYCCDEFLRSDCTHMLFIDSDIAFDANDVIAMLALMGDETEYDVLTAPYPKKCISWEKIKHACDLGAADENPNNLEKFVGDYVFNPANGKNQIRLDIPEEVLESGTGFMMFRRATLEKFAKEYPEYYYKPDHIRTEAFDGSREIVAFFDALIDNKHAQIRREIREFFRLNPNATSDDVINFIDDTKQSAFGFQYSNRYLSEDYMFCQWSRRIGLKVWLCPWIKLTHTGTYTFGGSLADIASIGVSATADPTKLNKATK
jgi:hypothetical protein